MPASYEVITNRLLLPLRLRHFFKNYGKNDSQYNKHLEIRKWEIPTPINEKIVLTQELTFAWVGDQYFL